jgi:type II secretory pathway pseudopilin PulG
MRLFSYSRRGMTLVETIVIVAIVAVLASVVMANLGDSRKKPRDAKRMSDLGQIQLALRMYKDVHGGYPATSYDGEIGVGSSVDADVLVKYLPTAFKDEMRDSDSSYGYYYDSDYDDCTVSGVGPNKKILYAKSMELPVSSNWATECGGTPPGTNSYIIILR